MRHPVKFALALAILISTTASIAPTPVDASQSPADQPYTVEYYYKVRWGFADEFLQLFKKNHWPILKKQIETGRMLSVTAVRPRYHTTEEGRWDYKVTIVFKNLAAAHDPAAEEAVIKQLYPDQATFRREEQRRFEILLSHWDVPLVNLDLNQ
jgi:hypothetical protein